MKYFCDAGPKSDARGDEKQGIYFVWPQYGYHDLIFLDLLHDRAENLPMTPLKISVKTKYF